MGAGFRGRGGGGGVHHMSPEEAQAFFGQFFGGSDPFGGPFGGMGGFSHFSSGGGGGGGRIPGVSMRSMNFGGGMDDPFSLMFSQGMGGSGIGQQQQRQRFTGSSSGMGRSESMPVYSSSQPQYDAIPPGTVVSLRALVNAPERNGDRGVIKNYIPSTGRYLVELEDSNETMSVKASNLLQHVHVRLHDIQNQKELNGKTGTILAWNPNKERYNVYVMALQKVVSVKPGNVVLEEGTVAQLTGINSRPELNGKWGTIKEWIRDSNKYDVQLSPQHVIRIKVENVRV